MKLPPASLLALPVMMTTTSLILSGTRMAMAFPSTRIAATRFTTTRTSPLSSKASIKLFSTTLPEGSSQAREIKIPKKFNPVPFHYHQELDIRIDSITNMGCGVGRISLADYTDEEVEGDDDRKWVVMVPHVIVGELVKVRIFRNQRNFSEADLVKVLERSPHRVKPKCAVAGVCGGCQYQHMSIEAQRDWKTQHVQEVLWQQQIDGYYDPTKDQHQMDVLPILGTDHVFGYRSKITPHYQSPNEIGVDKYEIERIGFQQTSNRNVVDVPECPIATNAINDKYKETRKELFEKASDGTLKVKRKRKRRGRKKGLLGATLLFRQADDDDEGNPLVVTDNNQYMTTTVKDVKFRYLAGNFFQNNNYVLPLMVDAVLEAAIKPTAASGAKPSYLIDCYCGSGLFALSAASQFEVCVGIEVNDKAVAEATANAELNGITNCQFMAASAEAIFTTKPKPEGEEGNEDAAATAVAVDVKDFPRDQTVVVVDPPRKGCSTEFLEQLYQYSPQRVVYMSCGPATQARDAKGIVEVGGYDIVSIQPFDLFPQTKHIECLMIFEKREQK